jgi:RNA processing factor Prp31
MFNKNKELNEIIISFIDKEEKILEERRKYFLSQKGEYTLDNLQSIQGQICLLERLKEQIKDYLC